MDTFAFGRMGTGSLEYEDACIKVPVKIEKKNGKSTASRIYLPVEWSGKHVVCLLLKNKNMDLPRFVQTGRHVLTTAGKTIITDPSTAEELDNDLAVPEQSGTRQG